MYRTVILHILACTAIFATITTAATAEGQFWSIVGPEGVVSERQDARDSYSYEKTFDGSTITQRINSRTAVATASGKNDVDIVMVGLRNQNVWRGIFDAKVEFERTGDEKLINKMRDLAVRGGAKYTAIAFSKKEDQLVGAISTNDSGYRRSVRHAYKIAAKKFKEADPRDRWNILNTLSLQIMQIKTGI